MGRSITREVKTAFSDAFPSLLLKPPGIVINPSQEQWKNGDLNLTVASTSEKVIMIEAGANEIPEDQMLDAIYMAHEKPPGIFPTEYNFSSYSTLRGKKSIPSLGLSDAVAVHNTTVSP